MLKKMMVVLAASFLLTVPAFASEAGKTVVQVSGTSQQEVTPDIARISLVVNSIQDNIEKAKTDNVRQVNKVMAALRDQGIGSEQIKTDTYQINPLYNYEKDKLPVLKGYQVTQRLEVRTGIEQAGTIVNEVTQAGASEISSIRFETADETAGKDKAMQEAIQDALRKAEVIAGALHKRVANITLINESGVFYNPVMLESRMFKAAAADSAAPNIPAGKVSIGANVQVTVELE